MAEGSASAHARGHPAVDSAPECTACGVCCCSLEPDYIGVYRGDLARMDEGARSLTEERGAYRVMSFRAGRCVALEMDAPRGRCRCAIYPMRPDCCRWLQPGSSLCQQLRQTRS